VIRVADEFRHKPMLLLGVRWIYGGRFPGLACCPGGYNRFEMDDGIYGI
jgi:hypothetical protein